MNEQPLSLNEGLMIKLAFKQCPACKNESMYKMNNCHVCERCGFYSILTTDGHNKRSVWPAHIPQTK